FHADTLHLARLQDSSLANWEQDVRFIDELNMHCNFESQFEAENMLREQLMHNFACAGVSEERPAQSSSEVEASMQEQDIRETEESVHLD
ncbi:unnamed protein product, partial [Amoebophrya sp. A25]